MKAFKTTYKDQYKQATNIKPGTYMFQAKVYFESTSPTGKYSISLKDEQGVVYNINLNWQVEPNKWCDISQQIEIEKKIVEFSLMSSELSPGEIIHIGLPQHEEGTNKSTPRANPLDDTEEMKNEVDLAKSYFASEFAVLEDRIILKVGQYRVGGKNLLRNYDLRFGMDYWSDGAEPVDETGTVIPITVATVSAPNSTYVYATRTPEVPEQVKLNLDNGSSVLVPVTWGAIDTSVAGEFNIPGTYSLPSGVTGDMPVVALKVVVLALTVSSVGEPAQVSVDQYRLPVLPTTIQLNLVDDTSINVNVSWSSYNTNVAGTYQLSAVYDFPPGVTGYKPTVKITLVVNEVADTGTFIDVIPYLTRIDNTGTDDWGNWVYPGYGDINGIIPHIIVGTSKLYARYRGSLYDEEIRYFLVNSTPYQQGGVYFPRTATQSSGTIGDNRGGAIREIYWWGSCIPKLYNLELRNDGSIPPWFIQ